MIRIAGPCVLAEGPCRPKAGSLMADNAVTTTGKYSGRHPAITALMAATSRVKTEPLSGIVPMMVCGSIGTVSSMLSILSFVGGTTGSPSVHSF